MKHLKRFIAVALAGFPSLALAATTAPCVGLCNPLQYNDLTSFLNALLKLVAQIGFPVIVLFMVYIGFMYVSSGGNADKVKKVHQYFLWAIVGALLILGAQALSYAIQATVTDLSSGIVQ